MRRLFLIRHAKAEPSVGRDDYERRLTDRGRADARRVAAALAARRMLPDLLIHSGAARAKETAEILAAEWPRRVELRKSRGSTTPVWRACSPAPARSRTTTRASASSGTTRARRAAAALTARRRSGLRRLAAKYPTGAVAVLDFSVRRWEDVERKSGLLALYLTPSELEAGAD